MSDEPSLPYFYSKESADLLVVNPLPWGTGGPWIGVAAGTLAARTARDPTASRHSLERDDRSHPVAPASDHDWEHLPVTRCVLPATSVPGYGYTAVARGDVATVESPTFDERATVETDRYRLTFDRENGGLAAWHDAHLGRQWVDGSVPWSLGSPIHEQPADEESGRASLHQLADQDPISMTGTFASERGSSQTGTRHDGERQPSPVTASTTSRAGTRSASASRSLVSVPTSNSRSRYWNRTPPSPSRRRGRWGRRRDRRRRTSRSRSIRRSGRPGRRRRAVRRCRRRPAPRYMSRLLHRPAVGRRLRRRRRRDGGLPLNPLVQFGEFSFARDARCVDLDRGLVLGWVTNNYWDTNFRASQPGLVRARYHLTPHGGFEEARAHRLGLAAEHADPLVHPWTRTARRRR